jgi:hypothetical protein
LHHFFYPPLIRRDSDSLVAVHVLILNISQQNNYFLKLTLGEKVIRPPDFRASYILNFGAMPVEVAVGRATAERRDPLDIAEENAGEAKPGWLRIERRAVKVVVSENDNFEEFGLGGICRTEGRRLETGEANGSVSDAADVAVFGRVSVPEEWPWVGRLSFSLLLLQAFIEETERLWLEIKDFVDEEIFTTLLWCKTYLCCTLPPFIRFPESGVCQWGPYLQRLPSPSSGPKPSITSFL